MLWAFRLNSIFMEVKLLYKELLVYWVLLGYLIFYSLSFKKKMFGFSIYLCRFAIDDAIFMVSCIDFDYILWFLNLNIFIQTILGTRVDCISKSRKSFFLGRGFKICFLPRKILTKWRKKVFLQIFFLGFRFLGSSTAVYWLRSLIKFTN